MKAMRLKELKKPICPESLAIRSSRVHMKPKFACPQSSVHYPVLPTAGLYPTSFPAVYHSPLPHHTQHRTSTWEASIDISGTELKKYEHLFLRQDPSHPFLCHVPKGWPQGLTWTPWRKGGSFIHLLCGRTGKWWQAEPGRNLLSEFQFCELGWRQYGSEFPCCFCIPTGALTLFSQITSCVPEGVTSCLSSSSVKWA